MGSVFSAEPKIPLLEQIRRNLARTSFVNATDNTNKENQRNITTLGTGQLTVTINPQQIGVVSRKRTAIKLTNLSAVTEIWYGAIAGLTYQNGDFIPAGRGQWVSIPGASVIWVVCAPSTVQGTGSALMSWAEKYDDSDLTDDSEI